MIYPLLKTPQQLMERIQLWARLHRDRLGILAEYRPNGEVRLISTTQLTLLSADNISGCTLSVRDNSLIIACAAACAKIEDAISAFLRKAKLIGHGRPAILVELFKRKNIRHAHEMGRPVSEAAKAKRRERREKLENARPDSRFNSVIEATLAAEQEAGLWVVMTERAKVTARESCYVDPDYVHRALMDLAHAARHNANQHGLGMSWADFLGQHGGHDFVPNTSPNTIKQYYSAYHITYRGESLSIQAHIRQGTGSARDCLRIYVVQPRKPGDPIIIGQVGAHLPTDERAH
jgi:hypothetical protein